MYDLSTKFNKFYNEEVVLPQDIKNNLREKKKLNIDRLEEGIKELNKENDSEYCIYDTKEQGSVAMSTVVQNDEKDYDIDVAIIFEESNIGEDTGTTKIKNVVTNALKKKCSGFKTDPEALTNCARIEYADGYHIDFAIYKKKDDTYYHAGSSWQERNPMAINDWFKKSNDESNNRLREVVRLSKMFCKSRDSWKIMPGGLIQSVLCEECLVNYDRLDECFYYTMKGIVNRLKLSTEVYNPTDASKSLLLKDKDYTRMNNWKNRLEEKLNKLKIVNDLNCTEKEAYEAWHEFFNHDYWEYDDATAKNQYTSDSKTLQSMNTEQFIEHKYVVRELYELEVDCKIEANGRLPRMLSDLINNNDWLPREKKLTFMCKTDTPKPYKVFWKVKNIGYEAEKRNMIRGQILKSDNSKNEKIETSDFRGEHFVECYVIKDDRCVARKILPVHIK